MLRFNSIVEKFQHFHSCLCLVLVHIVTFLFWISSKLYDFIISQVTHFFIELCYFIVVSFFGFLIIKNLKPRTYPNQPKDVDLFFTSVSAITVSSMSTVEMEVLSNSQLVILAILMFIGGEVFTSMVGLHFSASKLKYTPLKARSRVNSVANLPLPSESIELGIICPPTEEISTSNNMQKTKSEIDFLIKSKSVRVLGFIVLSYLIIVHALGTSMVLAYLNMIPSAKTVLEKKGLKTFTFSIFTIVSTFASCGFIPTNENMQVFSQNSGLLLILIPQILLGNTLYPSFLRFSIWVLGKFAKKDEAKYLMRNSKEIGFHHLLSSKHSKLLVVTVLGFIIVQVILFCGMEWNLEGLKTLNVYQKIVGVLFQCVNSRHTGESIVDLSSIASAILVLFIVMMYLPPYTSFLPVNDEEREYPQFLCNGEKKRKKLLKNTIFSQLSYLAIFIIMICITERQKMKDDPLNFNVFNIAFEVISAYGNVGFSIGYSCGRQLKADPSCVNKWYGFAGSWSDEGKMVLIIVMFFGRLKKFNMKGGKAWKLL